MNRIVSYRRYKWKLCFIISILGFEGDIVVNLTYKGGDAEDYKSSYTAGCNCWLGNTPMGWRVKSGSGMCGANLETKRCGGEGGYTQKCYWIKCQQNQKATESGCNSDFSSNSGQGCGSRRTYCYYASSSFLDASNSVNWKTSLSSDGYAKEVYIYSYPTRAYINYDANGTDLICGNSTIASWASDSNSYNINTGIKYVDGNPFCSTGFTINSMATSYIDYINGGNLRVNQYYKIGYDFKGWALTPNGNIVFNQDGKRN